MALYLCIDGGAARAGQTSGYTKTQVNGWTVYFSAQFSKTPNDRKVILSKIQKETAFITQRLPAKHVKVMRKADIWVEPHRHYHSLARYHNSKSRIYQEDLSPQKYRDVEVFGSFAKVNHPSLILHELAHVYHDRKLNSDNAALKRLFAAFETGFASAKDRCRKPVEAYALKNRHEFFATFTESYFVETCGYPYSRANIQKNHPKMFAFLQKTWGQ